MQKPSAIVKNQTAADKDGQTDLFCGLQSRVRASKARQDTHLAITSSIEAVHQAGKTSR